MNSTVSNNRADGGGGNGGGGIWVEAAAIKLENSTLSGNTAQAGPGGGLFASQFSDFPIDFDHAVELVNSTVSNNTAAGEGGGIWVSQGDGVTLTHSTIAFNSAGSGADGVSVHTSNNGFNPITPLILENTLIVQDAGETACNYVVGGEISQPDSAGSQATDVSCTGTATDAAEIALQALGDNGGPTQTHALGENSVAIDVADATVCENLSPQTDQRGFSRPADGDGDAIAVCDIGAFEKDAVLVSNQPPTAVNDAAGVLEDSSANTIDVAANDSDLDGNLDATMANTACGTCSTPVNGALVNNGNGTFDYTPDADFFGADSFVYEICDSDAACDTAGVNITVEPVNDAPSFVSGGDVSVLQNSGPQSLPWATGIAAGPANEAGQSLNFVIVAVGDPALFSSGPAIDPAGTLGFEPAAGTSGSSSVEVLLQDDGGTANGGVDSSATSTFTISVTAEADLQVEKVQCTDRVAPLSSHQYGIIVTNAGPSDAQNVLVVDDLPQDMTLFDSDPFCTDDSGTLTCALGTMPAGTQATVTILADVNADPAAVMTNIAMAASDTPDPAMNNNEDTLDTLREDSLVAQDGFESCGVILP